jgi:outer membrane autotransporter protein
VFSSNVTLNNGSVATGQLNGLRIRRDDRGEALLPSSRRVTLDASRIVGVTGSGLVIDGRPNVTQPTDATVTLRNGSEVTGGNGTAIEIGSVGIADIGVDASHIAGNVVVADGGSLNLGMSNGATADSAMNGNVAASIASSAVWNVTGPSSVASLSLDGGTVAFAAPVNDVYGTTTVRGDFSGSGGVLQLNTRMNEGGSLANQHSDRLLIEGNVTTTGTTQIVVTPSGLGAATDVNGNGVIDANEGISLVQVAGTSRADAFALRGGYVAAGAFQYTLQAVGPGQTDASQNVLASGALNWDYRLGNHIVCEDGCGPVDPEGPGNGGGDPGNPENPGNPGDGAGPGTPEPGRGRVAVVPQLPSYLSAPAALLTYGDMMNDGLHQRLGDIRQGASNNPVGGEVFARYLGGQLRYSSNLSFQRYGYDFDQQINALQLGGSLIALDGDNGSLRAGWAADKGTTRVTPKAVDGNSSAKYHANGVSAWITWQQGNGFWVDGVIGATRYRGDVGTDLRGSDVGNVRAHGWTTSIEGGLPIAIGSDWTVEPRFQLKHQQLNFRDFTDTDGLEVQLGTAKQTSATLGGRITRTAQPRFMPYASLDLTHTSNGDPMVDVSSEAFNASDRFGSGRVGNAYRVAAGAVSQLGEHVQVYGEGTYQHFVGSYGMRGWAGNVGIRVSF